MKILQEKLQDILQSKNIIREIVSSVENKELVLLKAQFASGDIKEWIQYLNHISISTLPNYHSIEEGASNSYRLNFNDERAYVGGHFRQISFYPWNQDLFSFFKIYKDIFRLKNSISGVDDEKFLKMESEDGCIARVSFQFYDSGAGYLNAHKDPKGDHQKAVITMVMSKRGIDFNSGGFFIYEDHKKINLEDYVEPGDLIIMNGEIPHGVDLIDPEASFSPLKMSGRWMALFAINKLTTNSQIPNSIEVQ